MACWKTLEEFVIEVLFELGDVLGQYTIQQAFWTIWLLVLLLVQFKTPKYDFFSFCNGVTSMQVIPLFITSNKSTNPTVSILSQCLNEVVWFLQENKQSPYKIRVMLADTVYIQCHYSSNYHWSTCIKIFALLLEVNMLERNIDFPLPLVQKLTLFL